MLVVMMQTGKAISENTDVHKSDRYKSLFLFQKVLLYVLPVVRFPASKFGSDVME